MIQINYDFIADSIPQLKRGMVWCTVCGQSQSARAASCLANGWPKCCGYTMTLDSPEERERFKRESE